MGAVERVMETAGVGVAAAATVKEAAALEATEAVPVVRKAKSVDPARPPIPKIVR